MLLCIWGFQFCLRRQMFRGILKLMFYWHLYLGERASFRVRDRMESPHPPVEGQLWEMKFSGGRTWNDSPAPNFSGTRPINFYKKQQKEIDGRGVGEWMGKPFLI